MLKILEEEDRKVLAGERKDPARLLLHSCCAPCSSSVLEQLAAHFCVAVLYYNPNIYPREEYEFRKAEQQDFIRRFPFPNPVDFLDCEYEPAEFYRAIKGLEEEPERGSRCTVCYRLRLARTAEEAAKGGYDYFATTLTLSPLKDPERLNRIGEEEMERVRVLTPDQPGPRWLPSDFKKRNGYLRSIRITAEYGMYRQDYCGCEYSLRSRKEH
ncbi:MAG: epoxyqueuosine reductase QueH [Lachnospiraceae bacterium]|nr:epoxyqueuosine reductase QueH [Lachnospiraceae bacterium]